MNKLAWVKKNGLFGQINTDANIVIPFIHQHYFLQPIGLQMFRSNKKIGFENIMKEVKITPKYIKARDFVLYDQIFLAWVETEQTYGWITIHGIEFFD